MSFENKTRSADRSEQAARSTTNRSPDTQSATRSAPDPSMMGQIWPSIERAEEHFGIPVPNESTLQRLEDHERTYGLETHDWIAEGMPAEFMGSPKSMEAFRQRQAERSPEVPTNIERQNRNSVFRSEKAATDTSPAGETGVPDPVRDVISSRGRSLDGSIQRAMENRMGDSFGDVRIHTGSTAAAACESINARAFTVGNHIAFNSGEYDPSSPEGQHVLAHELAHVRQQNQGAVSMLPQEDMELEVDPDPALEREAEEAAQQAMADGPVVINRMGCEMQIQRSPFGDRQTNNPLDSRPPADGGGVNEILGLLTNEGVDLGEENIRDVLADLDYKSIGKKTALGMLSSSAVVNGMLSGVDEIHGQLSGRDPTPEQTLQEQLGQIKFPTEWMDDLEAMGPPKGWLDEVEAHAENVIKSVTDGTSTKF